MPGKKLFLQTTQVDANKTVGEITAMLVKYGARTIETIYDNGKPAGLSWSMMLYNQPVYFRMPAKVEPVYQTMRKRAGGFVGREREQRIREQAERIAWRQLLAWVQVQFSIIELGMVEYAQVFLPYVSAGEGTSTVWDVFREQKFRAIEAPKQ